jgi:hypothetical protein
VRQSDISAENHPLDGQDLQEREKTPPSLNIATSSLEHTGTATSRKLEITHGTRSLAPWLCNSICRVFSSPFFLDKYVLARCSSDRHHRLDRVQVRFTRITSGTLPTIRWRLSATFNRLLLSCSGPNRRHSAQKLRNWHLAHLQSGRTNIKIPSWRTL